MANNEEDTPEEDVSEPAGVPAGSLQAGSELLQNKELYQMLFFAHPDGIVLTIDGKIALINDRAAEMSEYSVEEVIGMTSVQLIAPEERARAEEQRQAVLKHGSANPARYMLLRKKASPLPVSVHSKVIQHDGKPAFLSVVRDISAQRSAEKHCGNLKKNGITICLRRCRTAS